MRKTLVHAGLARNDIQSLRQNLTQAGSGRPRRSEAAEKLILVFRSKPQALKRAPFLSDLTARVELVPFPNQHESGFFSDLVQSCH